MSSTADQNKARRIRIKMREKKPLQPAEVTWLKDYESRTIHRKPPSVMISNQLPLPQLPPAPAPAQAPPPSTQGASAQTAPGNISTGAPSPASQAPPNSSAPPPLNAATPPGASSAAPGSGTATTASDSKGSAQSAASPELKFDEHYKPGPLGEQIGALYLSFVTESNASIAERGGTPYPEPLAKLGALSAAFLADKYGAKFLGGDIMVAFNAGMPVAWVLWQDHKLKRPDAIDTTATSKPAEVQATRKEPPPPAPPKKEEPPKAPPKPTIVQSLAREQETLRAAVGVDTIGG